MVFENDRVRVLEYTDRPGDRTTPHAHPDSVMITLSSYRRRLQAGGRRRDVELTEGAAHWLTAQHHAGENIKHAHPRGLRRAQGGALASGGSYLGPD